MSSMRTIVALSTVALVTACASPGGPGSSPPTPEKAAEHASHHPDGGTPASMAAMQDQMKAMQEMHDKMMNAKTPEERQALMTDHMKAMQGGMQMMKGMGGMAGMGGADCMSDPKGSLVDMAKCQQTMEQRMDMMQMMMEMMMQRMPASAAPPAAK
jgi:hypothetical protein